MKKKEIELKKQEDELKKAEAGDKDKRDPKDSPMTKFSEGFKSPEFMLAWNSMGEEARATYMRGIFQMLTHQ